jgi:hypothetical protein
MIWTAAVGGAGGFGEEAVWPVLPFRGEVCEKAASGTGQQQVMSSAARSSARRKFLF